MDLKETISELSDASLIELFKSESNCTYDYFTDLYYINLQTFKDCIDNGYPLSIYIRKNMEDCLINGLKKIKTYGIWDIHAELSKNYYNTNAIVFIDGDNMIDCIKRFNTIVNTNIKFVIGLRDATSLPKRNDYTNFFRQSNCYLLRTLTQNKEATDHMLSILIGALNVSIPKYIDFVICSNDKFALECLKIIENDCRSMKHISNIIIKDTIDKQIKEILNKYNIVCNIISNLIYNKQLHMYLETDLNAKCKRLIKLKTSTLLLIFTRHISSSTEYNSDYDFCIKNNLNYLNYVNFKLYGASKKYKLIKQAIIKYLLTIN